MVPLAHEPRADSQRRRPSDAEGLAGSARPAPGMGHDHPGLTPAAREGTGAGEAARAEPYQMAILRVSKEHERRARRCLGTDPHEGLITSRDAGELGSIASVLGF